MGFISQISNVTTLQCLRTARILSLDCLRKTQLIGLVLVADSRRCSHTLGSLSWITKRSLTSALKHQSVPNCQPMCAMSATSTTLSPAKTLLSPLFHKEKCLLSKTMLNSLPTSDLLSTSYLHWRGR